MYLAFSFNCFNYFFTIWSFIFKVLPPVLFPNRRITFRLNQLDDHIQNHLESYFNKKTKFKTKKIKMKLVFIYLALAVVAGVVNGHGRMMFPISRSSIWRQVPNNPLYPRYEEDAVWCELTLNRKAIENDRNATCGIAGTIYNGKIRGSSTLYFEKKLRDVYSYEFGSERYVGTIVEAFKKGEVIYPQIEIVVNHGGWVEFRVCPAPVNGDPTMECFELEQNKLKFIADGKTRAQLRSVSPDAKNYYTYSVKLPDNLTCEHCVLQWHWFGSGWTIYEGQKYYGKRLFLNYKQRLIFQ